MLKRIYVHNYRTLVDFEWEPPPACVLVGDNGSGKSALFEVLCLLRAVVVDGKTFEEMGFPGTRTAWLGGGAQKIEITLDAEGERYLYFVSYDLVDGRGSIEESLTAGGALLYRARDGMVELFGDLPGAGPRTTIPFDRRRSFLGAIEPRPDNRRITFFRAALAAMWALKPDPLRLGDPADTEAAALAGDLRNFASFYRGRVQEDPDATHRLLDDLRRVIPGFVQLRLDRISADVKDLRVRFEFSGRTHELGWGTLSDGQRLLVALYGAFRYGLERAQLVVLDEIENYVAPAEIQPWLRVVADALAERGQLIVIAHHRESIDYLAADALWRMWRSPSDGRTCIGKIEPDRDEGESAYELVKERRGDG